MRASTERTYVDTAVHNPRGFLRHPPRPAGCGRLQPHPSGLVLTVAEAGRRVTFGASGVLDGSPATLRRLHHLDLSATLARPRAARRPMATARLLSALAARGVPLVTGALPDALRAALHPDVVAALQSTTAQSLADPLMREAFAIRQRRAVLRRHSGLPHRSISVLVATRRPHLVNRVAVIVGQQRHADAELVLVTHGFTLRSVDIRKVRQLARVPVTVRHADDDLVLGDVLNIAVASASGDVVTKLDDDDHYGPHHLEDLLHSLAWSGATLVGAVDEFTHLSGLDLTVRHRRPPRQETTRRRVPGPTMTMRRDDLAALGGWARLPAHVDRALNDAVHNAGARAHCTHGLGFLRCRHDDRHTWSLSDEHFLRAALEVSEGLRPLPELYLDVTDQRLASLSSHVPTTKDMNVGCGRKPIEA